MLFDTHAHLNDSRFDEDREELIASLPQKGIGLVLNPGTGVKTSRQASELAMKYPFIYAAVGIHPHDAKWAGADTAETLAKIARENPKVRAVGEIGLDYHYDHSPRDIQQSLFREQMALAQSLKLPVIIHDREAHADCLKIVKEFPEVRGVYHCYSGSLESAKVIIALGYSISFTGVVTYKNAKHLPEVAAWVPQDRIFIETDAPYLSPEPYRGKRCEPSMLHSTAAKIAALRNVELERFEEITTQNAKEFFAI